MAKDPVPTTCGLQAGDAAVYLFCPSVPRHQFLFSAPPGVMYCVVSDSPSFGVAHKAWPFSCFSCIVAFVVDHFIRTLETWQTMSIVYGWINKQPMQTVHLVLECNFR